jgi:hypothetical protein
LLLAFGHPVWAAEHLTMRRNIMLRILGVLAVVAAVAFAAYGSAATLQVEGGTIQYGIDANLTCASGVTVDGWGLETDSGNYVQSVRLALPTGHSCGGKTMFVTAADLAGSSLHADSISAVVAEDATTVTFSFGKQIDPSLITQLKVWIEG